VLVGAKRRPAQPCLSLSTPGVDRPRHGKKSEVDRPVGNCVHRYDTGGGNEAVPIHRSFSERPRSGSCHDLAAVLSIQSCGLDSLSTHHHRQSCEEDHQTAACTVRAPGGICRLAFAASSRRICIPQEPGSTEEDRQAGTMRDSAVRTNKRAFRTHVRLTAIMASSG
jgi:hypothetical protein